jgi:hypothetical protein
LDSNDTKAADAESSMSLKRMTGGSAFMRNMKKHADEVKRRVGGAMSAAGRRSKLDGLV